MSQQLAILKNPKLWVDDRGLVTLRFDAAMDGAGALQVIYLEDGEGHADHEGANILVDLIQAAGDFTRLDGLPIIVDRDDRITRYVRPAAV